MDNESPRILYNDTCPLCRWEIDHYRRVAGDRLAFDPLADAARWGMTEDQAARALHVAQGGEVLRGLAAFRAIWAALPGRGWRWLAWFTGLPLVRPVAAVLYDRMAAPMLYRAHLRRQARKRV